MSGAVCAVMLVKDEEDVIEATLRHLLVQVDYIIVADNLSTDGTRSIVEQLAHESGRVEVRDDPEPGYYQAAKTTALAREVFERGFRWVLPCDADEIWNSGSFVPLRDYLDGVARDVQIVTAVMYHHIPTSKDNPADPNPVRRIQWRTRTPGTMPKVCCRARPDLTIHMGNHSAQTEGTGTTAPGLEIRHFSWRSEEQYLRKIRNGERAYAAAPGMEAYGQHWRAFVGRSDEAVVSSFQHSFFSADPENDGSIVHNPAHASWWT